MSSAFIRKQISELREYGEIWWRRAKFRMWGLGSERAVLGRTQQWAAHSPMKVSASEDRASIIKEKDSAANFPFAHCPDQPCYTVLEAHGRPNSRSIVSICFEAVRHTNELGVMWEIWEPGHEQEGKERNSEQNSCFPFSVVSELRLS